MRPGLVVAALALAVAGISGCASSEKATSTTTAPPRVDTVRDVQYAPGLRADFYLPESAQGRPTIVWIHGGGFTDGDKSQLRQLAEEFAQRGYPGVAIQYRLSDGGPWFPASSLDDAGLRAATAKAVSDTRLALDWLHSGVAGDDRLDGNHLVLAGYSAGAITAVSLAAPGDDPSITGVVGIAGAAIDPAALSDHSPPLLLLHGDLDDVVPITLAKATCAAAARQSANCTLETVDGAGHDLPFVQPDRVTDSIEAFLTGLA